MVDDLHATGLGGLLREHRRSWPQRLAVVDGDVRLTYPELDARVNRVANACTAAGVGLGDRILWLGQNSFRIVELLFAAAKIGAILCPANWRQTAVELAFVLDDLQPAIVVWQDHEIGDTVRAARAAYGRGRARWLQHDASGAETYEGFLAAAPAADPDTVIDPSDPVLLLYTAAFDGRPNGALLSHTALIGQGLIIGRLSDVDAGYVYLNCGPVFHVATLFSTLATLVHAGTNVFTPRVDAEELCRLIEAERCTGAFLVGPTFRQIRDLNRDGRYDISSLRAPAGRAEWNAMITVDTSPWARYPGGYGQTEVVGMLTFAALGAGAGGHGRTSPLMQMRIVDPDDREVEAGETGEITCRGPLVMNGYWNRPEETARRLRNGWHQRSRPPRTRRLTHLCRPEDPPHQIGRGEHLPGRGRGRDPNPPRRRRLRGDRRARSRVDAIRHRDRRRTRGHVPDDRGSRRALPGSDRVVQEASPRRVRRRDPASGVRDRLRRPRRAVRGRRISG